MAERGQATNALYVASALAMQAGAGFGRPLWIGFDSTSMAAYTAATNALTGEMSTGGLARGTTTVVLTNSTQTVANDACKCYVSTTPTSAVTIYGAGAFSASTAGNLLAFHEWAALVNAASTDTIQESIILQYENGV